MRGNHSSFSLPFVEGWSPGERISHRGLMPPIETVLAFLDSSNCCNCASVLYIKTKSCCSVSRQSCVYWQLRKLRSSDSVHWMVLDPPEGWNDTGMPFNVASGMKSSLSGRCSATGWFTNDWVLCSWYRTTVSCCNHTLNSQSSNRNEKQKRYVWLQFCRLILFSILAEFLARWDLLPSTNSNKLWITIERQVSCIYLQIVYYFINIKWTDIAHRNIKSSDGLILSPDHFARRAIRHETFISSSLSS